MNWQTILLLLPVLFFSCGTLVILSRKNFISLIIGLELILNAAAINFVVYGNFVQKNITGQIFALMIVLVAVAEAVVLLAIVLRFQKIRGNINVDEAAQLQS